MSTYRVFLLGRVLMKDEFCQFSRLRIGCVLGSRQGTFCRVLKVSLCYHAATRPPRTRSIQAHHRSLQILEFLCRTSAHSFPPLRGLPYIGHL